MKNFLNYSCILLLIFSTFSAYSQSSETEITLDKIIEHARAASLYRNNVDWTALNKEMRVLAKDANSVDQLKPALNLMIKTLNDSHGRVFYNNGYLAYYSGETKPHKKNIDWDTYTEIQSTTVYPFHTKIIEQNIGYVRIIGLPMGDNEKMATEIQDAVCALIDQGATSWIVDLRYNGGGNMFPMIEGLTNVIGDGIVGGTKGLTAEESSVWEIRNGDFFYDEQTVAIPNKCPITSTQKVAVLTSIYTASSGEALAVILKHREQSRFFGGKTNGMITATDWHQVDSLTAMAISVSYYKDRKGNVYDQFVDVDEEVEFNPKWEYASDQGIIKAINWLQTAEH